MNQVLNPKSVLGVDGISLMTCAGTSIGNGDATHRLIAYATEV
jgi:sortase (surface protein transpeptidase)